MNNNIGALWVKQSARGQYMTGNIEINGVKTQIVCFLNDRKTKETQPDWNILVSTMPSSGASTKTVAQEETNQEELNNDRPEYPEPEVDPNDIPF